MAEHSDSENEDVIDERLNGRDATVFLVDASASMFEGLEETDSPFLLALKCVHHFLCNKILSADKDSVAVVLYGTDFKVNDEKYGIYSHTCVMRDLLPPNAESILQIENLILNQANLDGYKTAATKQATPSLADALWLCSSIFSNQKSKQDNRYIYLVTNNDEPHPNFSDHQKQASRRVADLEDANIILTLFPMGTHFDGGKFYQKLLCVSDSNTILTFSNSLEELLTKMYRKSYKKRCTARIIFKMHDMKIGVGLYNLIRDAPMPKRIILDRRTNEPVQSQTTKFNAGTSETLLSSELTKSTTVGNRKIQMNSKELRSIKDGFFTGLTLLGFKPIKSLKLHLYLSPASFIYPDENLIKGSKNFMAALLNRCNARNVAAVCSLKSTAATKPRMVALLPQLLQQDAFGQCLPEGFHMIFLPYSGDIRALNMDNLVGAKNTAINNRTVRDIWRADEIQVAAAKDIIRKLTMKNGFSPELFENPALHTMWKAMEGIALNRDETETVLDTTMPDHDRIDRKIAGLSEKFNQVIYPLGQELETTQKKDSAAKSFKNCNVENVARHGNLMTLTAAVLKDYLSSQGISDVQKKKKALLIDMVKDHLNLA